MTRNLAAWMMIAGTVLLLAGCASPYRWVHPTVPKDKWQGDIAGCEAFATHKADEGYAFTERFGDPADSRYGQSLRTDLRRYDATKTRDRITAECLRDRGYQRVKVEK